MSPVQAHTSELCRYLNDHVLDEELTELDLLDALAACDLVLVEDQAGESAIGFYQHLKAIQDDYQIAGSDVD